MLKILLFLVLLVVGGIVYFNLNNQEADARAESETHSEYKQKQDDKDSVVESNNTLLIQLENIKEEILAINNKVRDLTVQKSDLNHAIDVSNSNHARNDRVAKKEKNNNKASQDGSLFNQGAEVVDKGKKVVDQLVDIVNQNLPVNKRSSESNRGGTINNTTVDYANNQNPVINTVHYTWLDTTQSNDHSKHSPKARKVDTGTMIGGVKDVDENIGKNKSDKKAKFTVPPNSVLSGTLTTGLLGRIPVNGQVVDPYRFTVQITDRSLFANFHSSSDLKGMMLSGTAQGDLLLSCVKANIDSATFIFDDGAISHSKGVDLASMTDDYGYPCIKGKLITNAAEYLSLTSLFAGLSSASDALSQTEQTVTTSADGNSTSSVTGDALAMSGYSALSGGLDSAQSWLSDRAQSSFDVIFVPSGEQIKLLTQNMIEINYDPQGRKLLHQNRLLGNDNDLD